MISSDLRGQGRQDKASPSFTDRKSRHVLGRGRPARRPAGGGTSPLPRLTLPWFLLAVLVLSACAHGPLSQRSDHGQQQPVADRCPSSQTAAAGTESTAQAPTQQVNAPRRLWVPMFAGDDPRERGSQQTQATFGPSAISRASRHLIPNMSYEETDALVAEIKRKLPDGDIKPACEKIYYVYYSNNDSFYVGSPVNTDADLRKVRIYQDRLHAILGPCLPFLMDWYQSFAMIQQKVKRNPRDPVLRQSYALFLEASGDAKLLHVAEVLLEELAANRRMSRAEGYAALARIRMRIGHSLEHAQEMVKRCLAMTKRRHVCPTDAELEKLPPVEPIDNL